MGAYLKNKLKIKKQKSWGVVQVAEHFPSKLESLRSMPSTSQRINRTYVQSTCYLYMLIIHIDGIQFHIPIHAYSTLFIFIHLSSTLIPHHPSQILEIIIYFQVNILVSTYERRHMVFACVSTSG
jgi:hypothetical protein